MHKFALVMMIILHFISRRRSHIAFLETRHCEICIIYFLRRTFTNETRLDNIEYLDYLIFIEFTTKLFRYPGKNPNNEIKYSHILKLNRDISDPF